MKNLKRIGIWMDHSEAHLMELIGDYIDTTNISSNFSNNDKVETLGRSENIMHNKENHLQATFYKNIGKNILNYDEVVLFGPTTAKNELSNILKSDHLFDHVKIELQTAGKMTEKQEHAFVKEYFKAHLF